MDYEYRQYQEDCEDALLRDTLCDEHYHPVVAVPTGGGKTKILSSFIYKYLEKRPKHSVLVLSHTETILAQDHKALRSFFPGIHIGLYSAGLKSKTFEKITVAGIQSIFRKGRLFASYDLIIVDECHTVPVKGEGMYRRFFQSHSANRGGQGKMEAIRVGLSGSPFRLKHGYVYKGNGALFNKLSYDLCSMENFNQLIEDGYLSNMFVKPPNYKMDTKGVRVTAGDYNSKQLSKKFDRESITREAVGELITFGKNYKAWLIFAIDIDHCENIAREINIQMPNDYTHGIKAIAMHSKTNLERHQVTSNFINGHIRAIVSVGMLTTGFDAPNIDLIGLLRPTKSPVLHAQMIGRGSRVHPGKDHCLVLDYAGNIARLGPINNIQVPDPEKKKKDNGDPIVKACNVCGCLHHPSVKICNVCGYEFIFQEKISTSHDESEVIQYSNLKWLDVSGVSYQIHTKRGTNVDILKVTYFCGINKVNEYVCYNHQAGYAKYKADNWVKHRWTYNTPPYNVEELYRYNSHLLVPKRILVDLSKKFPSVVESEFGSLHN